MKRSVMLGFAAALIVILVIVYLTPAIDDFRPDNPYWNGLSRFVSLFNPTSIEDFGVISRVSNPKNSVLMIIGPSKSFTAEEISYVRNFLVRGGVVVVADDFGSSNVLLEGLGVNVRLSTELLVDPLFKERSGIMPRVECDGFELVFNYATVVVGSGFKVLASSSSFSFLDSNCNFKWDEGEIKGPFPVIVELAFGDGKLIVVSDSSFLINSMIGFEGNLDFVASIISGKTVLLDVSHWHPSSYSKFRSVVVNVFNLAFIPEIRYSILILGFMVISRIRFRAVRAAVDRVDFVLRRHPDWDRDLLERLREEIRGGR